MPIVTLDFETAYSATYSLRKMSMVDYLLSPYFEIIGCAVKEGTGPSTWHVGATEVKRRLSQIDWSKTAVLAHNTRFDGAILAWHLGITPAMYLDTLSMGRAMTHSILGSSSLSSIAAYMGIGQKGDEVRHAMGKWLRDFTLEDLAAYGRYCCNDNDLCRTIFDRMMAKFPADELRVIDLALRMFIHPQAELDANELHEHLLAVRAEKEATFNRVAHIDKAVFSSSMQFATLLRSMGFDPPMKPSPSNPGVMIPALARGDREFKEMLDDDSLPVDIQAVLAARVSAKSTIEETRTEKTLYTARASWPDGAIGRLPVPLRYYGAHTGRFSGDDGYNWQNVKRNSRIRKAVKAKRGHVIVTRDASQIEARMVAWLAGQWDLVRAFERNEDVYSSFATKVYGFKVNKKDHPGERFVGKTGILGLGYGCGAEKFRHMLFIGSGGTSMKVDPETAQSIVQVYRRTYAQIPALWAKGGTALDQMIFRSGSIPLGSFTDRLEWANNPLPVVQVGASELWLPNGMPISYYGLRVQTDLTTGSREYVYGPENRPPKRIYGPKVIENLSQALSRIVITDIMRRVWASSKLAPMLQVHDSLAYVVPESIAEDFDRYLEQEFAVRPKWAPDLPLASEGDYGLTLAEAEGK